MQKSSRVLFALLASTSVLSAFPAQAQSAPAQDGNPGNGSEGQSSSSSDAGLKEIVVTAEKRESNIQKTSIAIQAITPDILTTHQVVELRDLNAVTPNVQIYPVQQSIQVAIRGIGSLFLDPRGDTATAISTDGLYYARPVSNGGSFFDLSRVEVLKGPQGTLYGRNAAAGAINLVSNRPNNKFEGGVTIDFGRFNEHNFGGMINVPVSDTFYVRAAGKITRRDGYVDNYYNDNHTDAFRLSALFQPTADISIYAAYNRSEFDGHGQTPLTYPCGSSEPWGGFVPLGCSNFGPGGSSIAKTGHANLVLQSGQINADFNLGFAKLSSVTGWVKQTDNETAVPNGIGFSADIDAGSETWSQEVRLASSSSGANAGKLAWVVGAYFSNSQANYFEQKLGPPTTFTKLPATSYAFFGQATYGLTDALRATAGIRYTKDKKRTVDNVGNDVTFNGDDVSYRAGLEYDVAPRNMIYLTYSTGYVAGGANGGDINLPTPIDRASPTFPNEKIRAIEFGSKNRFMDNKLQVNLSAYHYNFKNYQFFQPAFTNNVPAPSGAIQNLGDVKTYGAEFDIAYQITRNDRITLAGGWAKGEYGALKLAIFVATPGNPPTFVPSVFTAAAGFPLLNLPEWQLYAGYNRTFPLASGAHFDLSANTHLSTKYSLVPGTTDPLDVQRGYMMSDASLSFTDASGNYSIRAWIKNIENKPVNIYGEAPTFHLYAILPPRTYGVSLSAKF